MMRRQMAVASSVKSFMEDALTFAFFTKYEMEVLGVHAISVFMLHAASM